MLGGAGVKTLITHCAIMMHLPKLFAHASLILLMFEKTIFTHIVIIPNLLSLWTCPSKRWRRTLYGEGIETGVIDIFFLYIDSSTFLLAGNQCLFCKEVVVATYV